MPDIVYDIDSVPLERHHNTQAKISHMKLFKLSIIHFHLDKDTLAMMIVITAITMSYINVSHNKLLCVTVHVANLANPNAKCSQKPDGTGGESPIKVNMNYKCLLNGNRCKHTCLKMVLKALYL